MSLRRVALVAACVALALLACAVSAQESQLEASMDPEMSSFLEAMSTADAEFSAQLNSELADAKPKKSGGGGGVQAGGRRKKRGPNMRQGAADGSTLPPFDPFRINRRHERKLAREQAKRQERADKENERDTCKRKRRRAARRRAAEARERAAEKAALAAEKAQAGGKSEDGQVESFVEVAADAESMGALDAEMEADAEEAARMDAEADVDADEEAADLGEMEAEAGVETADHALLEHTRLAPTAHVTYGRENMADEQFDNNGGRAVFSRRARGQEIVRFEKTTQSSGGNAVVNGVTKLPCGKEITDKGLFSAVVQSNPGATVEAANPQPPTWVDDNINAVKRLPIVPQFQEAGGVDEYGDPL